MNTDVKIKSDVADSLDASALAVAVEEQRAAVEKLRDYELNHAIT